MTVLVIAPHPDDEILGCGGTIAKRAAAGDEVWVCIVTEGAPPVYEPDFAKMEAKEMRAAHRKIGVAHAVSLKYPATAIDTASQRLLNDSLSELVDRLQPDEVFIPHIGDIHRDHQIVAEAAMVACRPNKKHRIKRVLSYEVLSETDWNIPNASNAFIPTVYEDISNYIVTKCEAMREYQSQIQDYPSARSYVGIQGLALHRGVVVGVEAAEAFVLIREVVE